MRKCLVAEPDPGLQLVLSMLFEKHQLCFELVVDGIALVQKAHDNTYALIWVDWNLALINGSQAIKAIRRMEQFNEAKPAFIIATYTDEVRRKEMLGAGANEFLEKPFEFEKLTRILYSR